MKRFTFIICSILLLLIVAVPVSAADAPSITNISPDSAYTDETVYVTINGLNFGAPGSKSDVWLEKSGENDIIANTISSWTNTSIECRFRIPSSTKTGAWKLYVLNQNDLDDYIGFTIRESMTLTSISPTHAQVNNDSVDFIILGTGLSDVEDVFLYNNDYDNITAVDVVRISSTRVEGTFDLSNTDEDTYDVCVVDASGIEECDLSFEITTDEVGSIDISSSPSGASIYVDGTLEGTTPDTVDNLVEGSYKVVLKKTGYNEWGKIVKVTAGDTSTVNADLDVMTTAPTAVPTTRPTTAKTPVKSTLKVPTSWPSTTPATTATSPVDPAVIVGAVGLGLGCALLRKP